MIFTVDNVIENNLPKLNQTSWLATPTKAVIGYLLNEIAPESLKERVA